MRVLVTRAEPAASATAEALRNEGYEPVIMPLMACADTENKLPEGAFDGFIFTSANAPRILQKRSWRNADPKLPAFCVGRKTAQAALYLGFQNVTHTDGGGEVLAHEIHDHHHDDISKLLYLTTKDRQFDMAKALEPHGIAVETCDIYRMQPKEIDGDAFHMALQTVADGAMLVYSAQSARQFLDAVKLYSDVEIMAETRIIAISQQAAKPFAELEHQNIHISDVPDEISMFQILDTFTQ